MEEIILFCRDLLGMCTKNPSGNVQMLRTMSKNLPDLRWFSAHVEEFYLEDEALQIISHSPKLATAYLEHLSDVKNNAALQRRLIEVYYNEMMRTYLVRYNRLLITYLEHWDLSDEVKDIMYGDESYRMVRCIYQRIRLKNVRGLTFIK